MRSPLNPSLFNARLGLLSWLFICAFGMGLAGCKAQDTKPDAAAGTEVAQQEPSPCQDLRLWELELKAIELLDQGASERARAVLACTLEQHPKSNKAKILVEQLDANPVSYLGPRNYPYTVQSTDTLSKIAEERLGSPLKFVILARYNDIEIPANLIVGKTIKIPGEEPTGGYSGQVEEAAPPAPPSGDRTSTATGARADEFRAKALANEEAGELEEAFELVSRARASDPALENIDDDYARIKGSLIAKLGEQAYDLELSGSIEEAIANWRRVLEIDPGNISAQLNSDRLAQ